MTFVSASHSSHIQWKVSERDGSHTGEVVLCWVLVEQARHEHMSDEYNNRHIIVVVPRSPSWVPNTQEHHKWFTTELIEGGKSRG